MIYTVYDLSHSEFGYAAKWHDRHVYHYWDNIVSGHYYWVIGRPEHVHPDTRGWDGPYKRVYVKGRPDGAEGYPIVCNRGPLPNPNIPLVRRHGD